MTVRRTWRSGCRIRGDPRPSARRSTRRRGCCGSTLARAEADGAVGRPAPACAIGRAIVREPKVFLFDEPLSNLDAELRVQMRVEIAQLHEGSNTTMIYVTHDQVEAMTMADRIVVLRAGRRRAGRRRRSNSTISRQPVRRRLHRLAADEHAARPQVVDADRTGVAGRRCRRRRG